MSTDRETPSSYLVQDTEIAGVMPMIILSTGFSDLRCISQSEECRIVAFAKV